MGSKDRPQPIWARGDIHVPHDILVPLVDHDEASTISLPQLRDPFLATVTALEDLEQTTEKMARQALFQTRAPFRKGSHDEPRMIKKEEVRSPQNADEFIQPRIEIEAVDNSDQNKSEDTRKTNVFIAAEDVLNISEFVRLS